MIENFKIQLNNTCKSILLNKKLMLQYDIKEKDTFMIDFEYNVLYIKKVNFYSKHNATARLNSKNRGILITIPKYIANQIIDNYVNIQFIENI